MSEKHNNDIPNWVKDADDLCEHLKASNPMATILKSLFIFNKPEHSSVSSIKEAKVIIHNGIRMLLGAKRDHNKDIQDVDILIELYQELSDEKKKKFYDVVNAKEPDPQSTIMKSIDVAISGEKQMAISNELVYTDSEDIDYVIHALMNDGNIIVVIQEGVIRGGTESFTREEFQTKFKIKE